MCAVFTVLAIVGCARMGQPDGGWFDEAPPRIIATSPQHGAVDVKAKRVQINFDEYIKLENAQEKVTISPPQTEQAEIRVTGKSIRIDLQDSLKENTTYTIDFSDAISDNNEANPLGNYTYCFSTGDHIDTLEVAGYVLNAEDLEPIKGMLVGLYSNLADSAFTKEPMLRVGRTDASGHFIIRGVAEGSYRIYGLEDSDGDYKLSQRGERLAFSHDTIVPSCKPDVRQDTLWLDTLHIADIKRIPYTHFLPDELCLRAFTQKLTDRYLIKTERVKADNFSMFFSYGSTEEPQLRLLNAPSGKELTIEETARLFITEMTEHRDTMTYWLRDTVLVNQDTLRLECRYLMTDTLGNLVYQTDTLDILAKEPYAKRMKDIKNKEKEWEKNQEKRRKKGEPEEEMPVEALEPKYEFPQAMSPIKNPRIVMPSPLERFDTTAIRLSAKQDTLLVPQQLLINTDGLPPRTYELRAEWALGREYVLEVDSAAFTDIYGKTSNAVKKSIKVPTEEEFGSVFAEYTRNDSNVVVQLIQNEKVIATQPVIDGTAEFYYLKPAEYYIRYFIDTNANGVWDTGDYDLDMQPEAMYYHPDKVTAKAKWDITIRLMPDSRPLFRQKPAAITKQKGEKKKTPKNQNLKRAADLGIQYIPKR